ncbi:MAG TPA: phage tail sheath subtilisin-like domain-containing protein [Acidobacteriaceae bacterium]|jgi:hypothetical protein
MPEYQYPGVYVEEVGSGPPTIAGVGTTTTAFAGPTLMGPVAGAPGTGVPSLLRSFGDFQNIYGGYGDLNLSLPAPDPRKAVNYTAMAVKAFFDNGGSMLYVSRVHASTPGVTGATISPGIASSGSVSTDSVIVTARFPGAMLNGQVVTIELVAIKTHNIANLPPGTLLGTPGSDGSAAVFYTNGSGTTFMSNGATPEPLPSSPPADLYSLTLQVTVPAASGEMMVYSDLGFDPAGANFIGSVLGSNPPRQMDALQNQVWIEIGAELATPFQLFKVLFPTWTDPAAGAIAVASFTLSGGNDGIEPSAANYVTALNSLQSLGDIAIVGTPGAGLYSDAHNIMVSALIPHVEAPRAYRVAILESGPDLSDSEYQNLRSQLDSSYAALYVPWVLTPSPRALPGTGIATQVSVSPTGFVAGIYARSDTEKSVAKAPANEVVVGAVDLERQIDLAEQQVLNPLGINCLRYFPGQGYRVWGARTASSNPEWKYVNVRRYLVYLEHSIDNGTQWAVFETNSPALWVRVIAAVDSFLYKEFTAGNLLGTTPANAYFVRCDRTTMTQNDLDNGRLVCLIGVAVLKPAEFVIFRIEQLTASASS